MKKNVILKALLDVVKGMAIGIGAILPGISGGVLAVSMGVYKPVMNFLAHPVRNRRLFPALIPVGIGGIAGMLLFARLIEMLLSAQFTLAVWLFIGLIIGTIPGIWKESGRYPRTKSAYITLFVSFAILLTILMVITHSGKLNITPNTFWWIASGVMWGLGLVVPGLSPSSLLLFLGLYIPLAAGIAALSFQVILPMALGIVISVFAFARMVKALFDKFPSVAYCTIIGTVCASVVAIIPQWQWNWSIAFNALALIAGLALTTGMNYFENKLSVKD